MSCPCFANNSVLDFAIIAGVPPLPSFTAPALPPSPVPAPAPALIKQPAEAPQKKPEAIAVALTPGSKAVQRCTPLIS